jgi:putative transposase
VIACDITDWERTQKSDLKVHLVFVPKPRKPVLTGEVAIRMRDLLRQIAMEHELEIVSGKVARDHVQLFVSYRPNQQVSQIMQGLEGISSRVCRESRTRPH